MDLKNEKYITIVTGASDNHFYTSLNFLKSLRNADMKYKCYYYDLGLNQKNIEILNSEFPEVIYKKFDYSKYPDYFDININAGEYAWKPTIIYEISQIESNILLWCDAGNLLQGSLLNLYNTICSNNVYSPLSSGNIKKWTHILVCKYFNINDNEIFLNNANRNGAILGFNLNSDNIKKFIYNFYFYALIKDAICPNGSNRSNHRQDQALFTILYYLNIDICNIKREDKYISLSIHNDIGC